MSDLTLNRVSDPTKSASRPPPLHALLIGISNYASDEVKNLRGGVDDATRFKDYLEGDLKVPKTQIVFLGNHQATRSAIIQNLEQLKKNKAIEKNDPIFIFYAGHGAQEEAASDALKPGRNPPIPHVHEVLIPYDFSTQPGRPEIPAITDRELARLINDIYKEKGDNITLVLDCCHSASIDRGSDNPSPSVLVRGLDRVLPRSHVRPSDRAVAALPASGSISSLHDHILIAACTSMEKAKEIGGEGLFSTALLALLRRTGPNLSKLKYSDILERLESIPGQNPQCRGVNQNRFIFDRMVQGPQGPWVFKVDSNLEGKVILHAGSAHGVGEDDEFAVFPKDYTENDLTTSPLGFLTVSKPNAYSSTVKCDSNFSFTGSRIAVKTRSGGRRDLCLYIPEGHKHHLQIQELVQQHEFSLWNVIVVDGEKDAHLELKAHVSKGNSEGKGKVEAVIRVIDTKLPAGYQSVNRVELDPHCDDLIVDVLQGAAHYFRQHHRANDQSNFSQYVEVEFYKLEENLNEELHEVGQNLCKDGKVIELDVDVDEENVTYGVKLKNTSKRDLFPSLFYFNHSDFSIDAYYMHPEPVSNHEVEPPLRKDESLTIGYGPLGAEPFTCVMPPGQSIDLGYLKIFLFTQAVNQVEEISQPSPFSIERGMKKARRVSSPIWGTITIPIIQRRKPII